MSYNEITDLPGGARYFRCALQVNPYEYLARHKKPDNFGSEASYNAAIVEACKANKVEVVGITDHYRIKPAQTLIEALQAAGIVVFPGFEAVTKDGVHLLLLFDPSKSIESVHGYIHACGIHTTDEESPVGEHDAQEILSLSQGWGAQVIAAHCTQSGGLLHVLKGQPRANAFKHPLLNACALPGTRNTAPQEYRAILENTDPAYRRDREVAIINAADVSSPDALAQPSATTLIRMDAPTIEGLRHALLDHESRIRLNSDEVPDNHPEVLGMEVASQGFLKGLKVRFNEGLNVLIGGRGAGKSAIIECIRYALGVEPLGTEAAKAHKEIIDKVARGGTKITLHVQTYKPDKRRYRIERTVHQGAVKILDEHDNEVSLTVNDLLGPASVYGQSELAELARDRTKLTELLSRFVESDGSLESELSGVAERLNKSRLRLAAIAAELANLKERQAPLAATLATLQRYRDSGVEDRLSEQTAIVKSAGLVDLARGRLQPFARIVESLKMETPIPKVEFEDESTLDEGARKSVRLLRASLSDIDICAASIVTQLEDALLLANEFIDAVGVGIDEEKAKAAANFEAILQDLQTDGVDGTDFIRLREQVEKLQPLTSEIDRFEAEASALRDKRVTDLEQWRELDEKKHLQLAQTAKRVSKALEKDIRVTVTRGKDRRELVALIRKLGGRVQETIDALEAASTLDVGLLAEACRVGSQMVVQTFGFTNLQAEKLCGAGEDFFMELEEIQLQPVTQIEFNIAPRREAAKWKPLGDISVGQKATALLYLLMLESNSPLVLDQPEDNLDNRFVTKSVVPIVRGEKRRRQLIFSTHNANIPVLGDAEQIIAIDADGEAESGQIRLEPDYMGSIDSLTIANEVKDILEGGSTAFEDRRVRYGF